MVRVAVVIDHTHIALVVIAYGGESFILHQHMRSHSLRMKFVVRIRKFRLYVVECISY